MVVLVSLFLLLVVFYCFIQPDLLTTNTSHHSPHIILSFLSAVTLKDFIKIQHTHQGWLMDQIFEFLRDVPLFNGLNDIELEDVSRHCKLHRLGRNKIVLAPNQSLSCFIVMQGSLRILFRHEETEKETKGKNTNKKKTTTRLLELATLGVGNTFGGARLSQGCSKADHGIALVTSPCTVRNQIIEIAPVWFFKLVIRQNNSNRQLWTDSLISPLANGFELKKIRKGSSSHSVTRPVSKENYFSSSLSKELKWNTFKDKLMIDLQNEKADGGIGDDGGVCPVDFRVRDCAPGNASTAKGRQRIRLRGKRDQDFTDSQQFRTMMNNKHQENDSQENDSQKKDIQKKDIQKKDHQHDNNQKKDIDSNDSSSSDDEIVDGYVVKKKKPSDACVEQEEQEKEKQEEKERAKLYRPINYEQLNKQDAVVLTNKERKRRFKRNDIKLNNQIRNARAKRISMLMKEDERCANKLTAKRLKYEDKIHISDLSKSQYPSRIKDSALLLKNATEIQIKGGALHDFARKEEDRVVKAGTRFSLLTPEAAVAIAKATNTKIANVRPVVVGVVVANGGGGEVGGGADGAVGAARATGRATGGIPWWETTTKKKSFLDGLSNNKVSKSKSIHLASRSIGSVQSNIKPSPKRPYCTVAAIRRRPSPRLSRRMYSQQTGINEKNEEEEVTSWIPTRRVAEEVSVDEHRGRKLVKTGRWHAAIV
jgi:hypothetical protein